MLKIGNILETSNAINSNNFYYRRREIIPNAEFLKFAKFYLGAQIPHTYIRTYIHGQTHTHYESQHQ